MTTHAIHIIIILPPSSLPSQQLSLYLSLPRHHKSTQQKQKNRQEFPVVTSIFVVTQPPRSPVIHDHHYYYHKIPSLPPQVPTTPSAHTTSVNPLLRFPLPLLTPQTSPQSFLKGTTLLLASTIWFASDSSRLKRKTNKTILIYTCRGLSCFVGCVRLPYLPTQSLPATTLILFPAITTNYLSSLCLPTSTTTFPFIYLHHLLQLPLQSLYLSPLQSLSATATITVCHHLHHGHHPRLRWPNQGLTTSDGSHNSHDNFPALPPDAATCTSCLLPPPLYLLPHVLSFWPPISHLPPSSFFPRLPSSLLFLLPPSPFFPLSFLMFSSCSPSPFVSLPSPLLPHVLLMSPLSLRLPSFSSPSVSRPIPSICFLLSTPSLLYRALVLNLFFFTHSVVFFLQRFSLFSSPSCYTLQFHIFTLQPSLVIQSSVPFTLYLPYVHIHTSSPILPHFIT